MAPRPTATCWADLLKLPAGLTCYSYRLTWPTSATADLTCLSYLLTLPASDACWPDPPLLPAITATPTLPALSTCWFSCFATATCWPDPPQPPTSLTCLSYLLPAGLTCVSYLLHGLVWPASATCWTADLTRLSYCTCWFSCCVGSPLQWCQHRGCCSGTSSLSNVATIEKKC